MATCETYVQKVVIALVTMFFVALAAARAAGAEIPTATDFAACNAEAPRAVQTGATSPTTGDRVRADRARAGATTVSSIDVRLIESSDPQIHGMEAEGAKEATYQAAYRSCMRRKGF